MKTSLKVRAKGSIAGLYLEEKYNSPLELSLQWMKEKGRRGGIMRGREVGPAGPVGPACVERLSIRFQETHSVATAEAPFPGPLPTLQPLPPSLANTRLTSDGFVPRLLTPKGAAITVTDTSKPKVEGFSCSSSYPADCEAGCTLTVVPILIKGCRSMVAAFGG